jgi:hypothetical protein
MDLRNWEFYIDNGNPVVGATVKVRDAILSHPNTGTVLSSTTTDANGMWAVTSLTDTPKDVEVIWGNVSQFHKWYKGMTRHDVSAVFQADSVIGVRAARSTNQSFPNVTFTAVTYDLDISDPYNMHDTVSNTDRLVATVTGLYQISSGMVFAAGAGTVRIGLLALGSGGIIAQSSKPPATGASTTSLEVATIYPMSAGDYVRFQAYQDSGGALGMDLTFMAAHFEMTRLGS